MPAENTGSADPFDLEKLRELIALMEEHGLSEIDLRRQDQRWKLRRGPADVMQMIPGSGFPAGQLSMAPHPPAAPSAPAPQLAAPVDDKDIVPIKSHTVRTYYESPTPCHPAFV